MATPNGTGHEDARLFGGGEGPDHWLKVLPLDNWRDHWEMRNIDEDAAERLAAQQPAALPPAPPLGGGGAAPRGE